MKTLKNAVAFAFFFLFILTLNAQTREVTVQGRTYEYAGEEDEYYMKSGNKKYHLVKDNVIVKLKSSLQLKSVEFAKYHLPQLEEITSIGNGDYKLLKIPKGNDLLDIFTRLQNTSCFETIEPNVYAEYFSTPNDYYYTNNYHWNLAKIEMPKAWDITTGSSNIKVAVIGGGANYSHEDLINQLNIAYKGWNYATNTEDPVAYHYHETRCAGIIGGSTNNSIGVSGIAGGWNDGGIKMMYFQCQPDVMSPPTSYNIGRAIGDAVLHGAKVISMSLGGLTYLEYLNQQITTAKNAGVVICVASGNYEKYIDTRTHEWIYEEPVVQYPASHSGVISVGATIENDYRKEWNPDPLIEDWGSSFIGHLDIMAPGINIPTTDLETYSGNKYTQSFLGTSAAAPHVAGVAALILTLKNNLNFEKVKYILTTSADWDSHMNTDEYGGGRLNAYNALLLTHAFSDNNPKSISQTATANNGQRKVVKDASGNFHTVFSSGGEIFYRKSILGTSWQDPVKISYVNGSNDAPSIAVCSSSQIMLTWQRNTGSNTYDIYFALSTNSGSTWSSSYKYVVQTSVMSTVNTLPVIAGNSSNGRKTILFTASDGLKSRTTTVTNPSSQNDWTLQTVMSSNYIQNPTISHNSTYMMASYQNTSDNHIYFIYQNSNGSWQSPENVSSIVPGAAVNKTPSISAIPSGGELHTAWARVINGGVSNSDYKIIHRKKGHVYYSWPSEYFITYYEGQQLPSISGLATNKVDLLFQSIPSMGNQVYKMRFNGTSWNSPTLVASNAVYPSVSIGSTTAKYVYTSGTVSPYTVTLSGETLSKESEFNPDVYSRSIAIMNNPDEYLEIVLSKMYFKMKDGSKQRIDFLSADLEELKIKEDFDLTTNNAWNLMKGVKDLTIPVGADELVFDYTVRGENVDKVIEGNLNQIDLSLGLNIPVKSEKAEKIKPIIINSGKITETKLQEIIPLNSLKAERGFDKVDIGLKVKGIVPKSTAFASLGHIFDFTNVAVANETQANKTNDANGAITEELTTQNYPNPFNPTTLIRFTIKQSGKVTLKVYDVLGREVAELLNTHHESGSYEIPFDGSNLPSGIYFYNLTANGKSLTKKMMLLK